MKVKSPGCGVRDSQLTIHKCQDIAKGLRKRQQCRYDVRAARFLRVGEEEEEEEEEKVEEALRRTLRLPSGKTQSDARKDSAGV